MEERLDQYISWAYTGCFQPEMIKRIIRHHFYKILPTHHSTNNALKEVAKIYGKTPRCIRYIVYGQ